MGKYYLGLQSGTQTNFSVVDATGVISDLDLSGLYLSATGKAADAELLDGLDGTYYRNAANLTGTLFVEITGTVPNSEKLNGQSGSYYRDITNITGALTTGSSLLYGDGSGRFANATIGSGLLFTGGVLHATGGANLTGGANILVTSTGSGNITISTTTGAYSGTFSGMFTGVFLTRQVYNEDITIPSGFNGLLVGPVGINSNSSVEAGGYLVVI